MTRKNATKRPRTGKTKKLTLKRETLTDLSASGTQAEQLRGGYTSVKHQTGG